MADRFIYQMEPWIGAEERDAVFAYLESGGWLTEYQHTRAFEKMIADYTGASFASVVSNGTVSLFAALMACGVGPGDEVIVPDFTMIATANAVLWIGAKAVLVDIDEQTLCLDLEKTEAAITPRTRAIMVVALNGRAPDMAALGTLCEAHGLWLIEDSAQALGAQQNGRHLGTFGHVGSFSFSAQKIITTGQGGALVTNDADLYDRIVKIRDFGRERSGVDVHIALGYNLKFTDVQAVIGIEQMKKLPARVERKKEMFARYRVNLEGLAGVQFVETNLAETPPWFIDVLVEDRESLATYLKDHKIGTRPFYPSIHTQVPYRGVTGDFPVTERITVTGLWLPSSSFLTHDEIDRVCAHIRAFYRQ
jgi:perosamine synthetase